MTKLLTVTFVVPVTDPSSPTGFERMAFNGLKTPFVSIEETDRGVVLTCTRTGKRTFVRGVGYHGQPSAVVSDDEPVTSVEKLRSVLPPRNPTEAEILEAHAPKAPPVTQGQAHPRERKPKGKV